MPAKMLPPFRFFSVQSCPVPNLPSPAGEGIQAAELFSHATGRYDTPVEEAAVREPVAATPPLSRPQRNLPAC